MDFRKCPACQASVLEDDVDDCPFCGASMSGKPKPKAASLKAAAVPDKKSNPKADTSGAKTPAKKKPTSSGPSKAEAASGDDDPFEVDTSAVRKAIKLSPRPTKSRTYEIVCPMCETKGFMPPSEAGKDVQCANPECIVPVFKSKRPKVEAPPEEEPKSKKGLIIGVSAVALLAIAFGVYSMMSPQKPNIVNDDDFEPPKPPDIVECDDCKPVECDNCKPEAITLAEIKTQSKTKVVDAARDRGDHNKNVGTQLAAETLAIAGDLNAANSELKRLQSGGRATGYLQLQPFAEIAWEQLRNGDVDGATKSATDGLTRAKNLPPTVRRSLDSVMSLAAVLTAVGKKDEAVQLIADQFKDAEGELGMRGDASVLWRTALDSATYDVGLEASRPYHSLMPESLRIGVIETLVAHGYPDEAWTLIETASQVSSQDACRAAWAGRLAEMKPDTATKSIEEALAGQDVSPTGMTRVWAAVAAHLKAKQMDQPATAALTKAVEAAGQIPAPKPVKPLTMKHIYESQGKAYMGLANPSQEESSAMACADISLVSVQFEQLDQADEYLKKSMAYARATTPSPVRTQELLNECETQEGSVKSQLQSEISIGSSAPELRSAFNRYRRQCVRFNTMAQERLQKQVVLLRAMAHAGLRKQVWAYVVAQSAEQDVQVREMLLETTLPGLGIVLADLNLENELKQEILDSQSLVSIDVVDRGIGNATGAFLQGNWKKSGESLREFYKSKSMKGDRDRADIGALGLICDVMRTQSTVQTFEYLVTLSDPVLRQDGFMLFAAYAAQQGTAHELWEHMKTPAIRELDALDKASIYRGFVTGALAKNTNPTQASTPAITAANEE